MAVDFSPKAPWISMAYLGRPKYQKKCDIQLIQQNLLFEDPGWERLE